MSREYRGSIADRGGLGGRGMFQSGAPTVLCLRGSGGPDVEVYKAIVEFIKSKETFWLGRPGVQPRQPS